MFFLTLFNVNLMDSGYYFEGRGIYQIMSALGATTGVYLAKKRPVE